ncbi:hypothetical protein HY024_03070 [Candidatus Curtissbacteria bacterium]|nr:hypothetical protein [Candidatus Curtissbacteria bacterium]
MSKDLAFVFSGRDIETTSTRDVIYFPLSTTAKEYLINKGLDYQNIESFFPASVKGRIFDLSEKLSFRFTKAKIKLVSNFDAYSPLILTVASRYAVTTSNISKSFWLIKYTVQFALLPKVRSGFAPRIAGKVIIIAANTYHVKNCLSLISTILNGRQFEPLVIGKLGNSRPDLERNKIKHIDYSGWVDFSAIPQYVLVKLFLLIKTFFYVQEEKISFLGYDLWDLIKPRLISLFLTDLPALYLHEIFYSTLMKTYDVQKFIYLTNASNIQTYIRKNKAKNIESWEIQHGITFGAESKYFCGDKMIAWGEIPAEILASRGISWEKILIGGWPPFIDYSKLAVSKSLALNKSSKKKILFLAQDSDGLFLLNTIKSADQSYEQLFGALSKVDFKYRLRLRLHPRADTTLPFSISKKYKISFDLSGEETLKSAIEESDLIIAQTTSAALDALILSKPVIYFPSMEWGVKFLDEDNVNGVTKNERGLVKLLLDSRMFSTRNVMRRKQRQFLQNYSSIGKISIKQLANTVTRN